MPKVIIDDGVEEYIRRTQPNVGKVLDKLQGEEFEEQRRLLIFLASMYDLQLYGTEPDDCPVYVGSL